MRLKFYSSKFTYHVLFYFLLYTFRGQRYQAVLTGIWTSISQVNDFFVTKIVNIIIMTFVGNFILTIAWSTGGCTVVEMTDTVVVCSCNHLTNFGVLAVSRIIIIIIIIYPLTVQLKRNHNNYELVQGISMLGIFCHQGEYLFYTGTLYQK